MTSLKKDTSLNKNIHVLHLVSGDLWAGAEAMLYTLVKTLHTELNTQVTVVILNTGTLEQKLRECGVPVFVLDELKFNSLQIFSQLRKIINEIQPDILHSHRIKENILGSIAAWYMHRIPSIRTVHGASEHRPPFYKLPKHIIPFLNWFCGRFLQQYIIAVSGDLAKKLTNSFPESKIEVIENGVDINALLENVDAEKVNTTVAEEESVYHIGIAGRLTPVKRVDLFIECAVHLKQHRPDLNIHFHIFGSGPLQEKLEAQVNNNQARDYIHFEGHTENIPQQLQMLNALLMTSDHEGLPMILLEAMCMKTPIISHAVGGIPNLLNNGNCGTLTYEHHALSFANAIVNLVEKPAQHVEKANLAFKRLNQYYSAKKTASSYLNIYRKLIE